jgi:hypothetical protein
MTFRRRASPAPCRRWLLGAVLVAAGSSTGCGGASGEVSRLTGAVTLNGEPLPADAIASVSFRPADVARGRPASAQIVDGRYRCDKAPRGKVIADVNIALPTGRTRPSGRGQEEPELKTVVLAADQADGIELDVTGDASVDLELRRAKQ